MQEDIELINKNLTIKNEQTDGNFLILCKLFKMLELELVMKEESNVYLSKKSIFTESVLYNVPNIFFEGNNLMQIFTNIVNYLKQCDIKNIKKIDDSNQQLFSKNGYYANSYYSSFVKKMLYVNEYGNEMIDEAIKTAQKLNQNADAEPQMINDEKKPQKVKKIQK